jgi:DNA helicase-4
LSLPSWRPSKWAKLFALVKDWQLTLNGYELLLVAPGLEPKRIPLAETAGWSFKNKGLWLTLSVPLPPTHFILLRGLSRDSAISLRAAIEAAREAHRQYLALQLRIARTDACISQISEWLKKLVAASELRLKTKGWLSTEFAQNWSSTRPENELLDLLEEPALYDHLLAQAGSVQEHVRLWQSPLPDFVEHINALHFEDQWRNCKPFFDTIEKSPLTRQQALAVACFDNRVQVIAAAGSGKTATIVAKTAHALAHTRIPPEKILLLTFNTQAAIDLRKRLLDQLKPKGLPFGRVTVRTFHSFGLQVNSEATGRKTHVAPWVDQKRESETLAKIVDDLKDRDPGFRAHWDLFRVILGRDKSDLLTDQDFTESLNRPDSRKPRYRTMQGELVRSKGEWLIADWLFYNGVNYKYEEPYPIDTTDALHRQYAPDFYYPDIDAFHEHWALDSQGRAPKSFVGYEEGMVWKRKLHRTHKTTLIQTTAAQIGPGEIFVHLEQELTKRGIVLDPNPDRPAVRGRAIQHSELIRTVRTFLKHVKSNRIDTADLYDRLQSGVAGSSHHRNQVFLEVFVPIREEWERKLRTARAMDFEDMVNHAVDHLEAGTWQSPYELVMVDEFQDVSEARARLVHALVAAPGHCLYAVGDDWQSINRFAGADMTAMTQFEKRFGAGTVLKLEQTFRSPQSLCDISSAFVKKNPDQLNKHVVSTSAEHPPTLQILEVEKDEMTAAVLSCLLGIDQNRSADAASSIKARQPTVYVLGRYRLDEKFLPSKEELPSELTVTFSTIHGAKGLEADHVIVVNMSSDARGFPNRTEDDPVLRLAMPHEETFESAEERRIFYVALTRARRSVTLMAPKGALSSFVVELMGDHGITPVAHDRTQSDSQICPKCRRGILRERRGPWGLFEACGRYPDCDHSANLKPMPATALSGPCPLERQAGVDFPVETHPL